MNLTMQDNTMAERADARPESKADKAGMHRKQLSHPQARRRGPSKLLSGMKPALALMSLGLGVLMITKPRRVTELVGVRARHKNIVRLMGMREIGHALSILAAPRTEIGVWSRVAGDGLDLAAMSVALRDPCTDRSRSTVALGALAGIAAADLVCARQLQRWSRSASERSILVVKSILINQPAARLYAHWHNFESLPQFMEHLQSVEDKGNGESHWVARGPAGTAVAWDAKITEDRPNQLIAWTSQPGAAVPNCGQVQFEPAPNGRGTIVTVELQYQPPAGKLGKLAASLFGEEPEQQIQGDLRRFKQVMETGEVLRSDATLHGTRIFDQSPAQPPAAGPASRK